MLDQEDEYKEKQKNEYEEKQKNEYQWVSRDNVSLPNAVGNCQIVVNSMRYYLLYKTNMISQSLKPIS